MTRMRFCTVDELIEKQALEDRYVADYIGLLQSLREEPTTPAFEAVRNWLWASSWRGHGFLLWAVDEANQCLIATAEASIIDTFVPMIYVSEVAVAAPYRRQGYGGRMMRELIAHAKIRWPKADRVELSSHPRRTAARQMYAALGFRKRDTGVFTLRFA